MEIGTSVLRGLNTAAVLQALVEAPEPLRIAELKSLTNLTRPTVAQAVEELISTGLVGEVDAAADQPRRGRPASFYDVKRGARPVVGIDMGPHFLQVVVVDLGGRVLGFARRPTGESSDARELSQLLDSAVTTALRDARIDRAELRNVVVGTPGIIDPETGRPSYSPSMPEWSNDDLASAIATMFEAPTTFENDANLAAVAAAVEWPNTTLIAVQWGERLGAGLVVGSALHRGANGAAGEIGWINTAPADSHINPLGQPAGVLESRISGTGLMELAHRLSGNPTTPSSATELFADAADSTPYALDVIDVVVDDFVRSVSPVILALDPQVIVVGGGFAHAGDILLRPIREQLAERTLRPPKVVVSELAEQGVVRGAAELARQQVWEQELTNFGRAPTQGLTSSAPLQPEISPVSG